jgi:flagellar hook-associated protein 2
VDAYNKFSDFVQAQFKPGTSASSRPPLATDTLLRASNRQLRAYLTGDHANSGAIQSLAELGITMSRTGKLEIDDDELDNALASNRDDVEAFFGGASGFASKVSTFIDSYTQSGGAIDTVEARAKKTIDGYASKIFDLEGRLALREEMLTQQFAAADRAMSQMNSQINALNGLGGQFRLF